MNKKQTYAVIAVGLGNPGKEYDATRHNAGRRAVTLFAEEQKFPEFAEDKKLQSLASEGKLAKTTTLLVLPETCMNKSGSAVGALKLSKKDITAKLVVLHDDLDLPLGAVKIVKNRGSAGHKGVESVMRALRTQDFTRIRIGIAKPADIKKSQAKTIVHKIVIGKLASQEKTLLQKGIKKAASALQTITENGVPQAMNEWN